MCIIACSHKLSGADIILVLATAIYIYMYICI